MLVGGALVNALEFSGSNSLFSMLRSSGVDEEHERLDKVVEQQQTVLAEVSQRQTERLDWIDEELRLQNHPIQSFSDVDAVIREYSQVTGKSLDPPGGRTPNFPTSTTRMMTTRS